MSLRLLARLWNRFFFRPEPPLAISLYRIFFGLLIGADLVLMWPDWLMWFGEKGVLPLASSLRLAHVMELNILRWWPQTDFAVNSYFWIFLFFAACLTFGLFTRLSSIVVYVMLVSLHHRNPYILNAGDTVLRVMSFFLMFAPAGAAMSLDRLWRICRGKESLAIAPRSPWAQRMIQIQLSVIYFSTVYFKTQGIEWINGTALYYVMRLKEFRHFPVPEIRNFILIRALTWMTLVIEFSVAILIWFKELRYYVIAAATLLHLAIDYSLNIPLFQWVMIATFVTFVPARDLTRAAEWMRSRIARWAGPRTPVLYDDTVIACVRTAVALQALDILGRLRFEGLSTSNQPSSALEPDRARPQLLVRLPDNRVLTGFSAFRWMARKVPLLWPVSWLLYLPGISRIAARLHRRSFQSDAVAQVEPT